MNAHARLKPVAEEATIGQPMPDGSLLITAEQLALLGNGDAKRGRRNLRLLLAAEADPKVYDGPTPKPDTVRIATSDDEMAILGLIMMDLQENCAHIAPIDSERVVSHIMSATRRQGSIIGVIDGPEKKPVALTLLVPAQWWFSRAYYVTELINYVHPEHRKSSHIHDLIQFERWVGDEWSRNFGYRVFMLLGVLGTKRVREKVLLYKRKLAEAGRMFLYPSPNFGMDKP